MTKKNITSKNIACRIFKEQVDLIKQLPQEEQAQVLWQSVKNAFDKLEYQNDNQIENQNESAYVSVSVSVLSNSIIDLLSKNIVAKEFSTNYGGKRDGAGSKPKETKTKPRRNLQKVDNKEEYILSCEKELQEPLSKWLDYRKEFKKKEQWQYQYKKLQGLNNPVESVEHSIGSGYKGLFEAPNQSIKSTTISSAIF